jgi:STE24 endopeptidase
VTTSTISPARPSSDRRIEPSGGRGPDRAALAALGPAASLATAAATVVCVAARLPHHLVGTTGIRGWALVLVVVVFVVNGAGAMARAPFTFARAHRGGMSLSRWATGEGKAFMVTSALGALLTLPLYALLRATPAWWLWAWALFAAITVGGVLATPLALRARSGPLAPAPAGLAERVRAIGRRCDLDVDGGVLVAGPRADRRCNAYVVGLGPTRRVVLEDALAAWPPALVDQVVAHELGHWRLGHTARRLPLTVATQLATFAIAAWVLVTPAVLGWAGVSGPGDPRSYPMLLLLTPVLALPARCLLAWRDRAQERAADRFALDLLQAPADFSAMLDRAADEGGGARRLSPWRRLTASHPPIDERALACTPSTSIT